MCQTTHRIGNFLTSRLALGGGHGDALFKKKCPLTLNISQADI